MAVLKQPYTGIRGMRYQFMLDNLPEKVAELKASGETESYLEQIETAYRNRISELTPGCMKSCGATTELRSSDLPSFIKKANSAESRERSRSLTDPGTQARGAKRAAGSSARDGAAGRGPAL